MRRLATLLMLGAIALACATTRRAHAASAPTGGTRFKAYEIVIDSGSEPLAAWQVEIANPTWQIVGVEGGAPPFDAPAYHDPAALEHGLIVLAGFTTSADVRAGAQRVAILHVAVQGSEPATGADMPTTNMKIIAAADPEGRSLRVTVNASELTEMP